MSEPTIFDSVNFHPDEWRFYAKGTRIAGDDLGAYTFKAQEDGWYYVESLGVNGFNASYMPPDFDPAWLEKK